ncbi:excinuclease ABC subunit UvrA [Chitinophaga sp. Mgbs1]|uniref:UvrABC system protein A n=1 Tax=Chitinophaga solisilvae TaxID=1233460 RepID=A0A433WHW6_9BACT|nr:excinuclease ABC subunit UvrA [Chitinophaga solisilvae]
MKYLHNKIIIKGARENNLQNISLEIPKNEITVFTGVSGSGKSSLVFDTIGAESQRQLNETFDSFIRHRLPHYGQPEVDRLENLSVAIIINQKRIGGNARSTVGTITDIYTLLRLLFSRTGQPFVGYSNVFSFNNPLGMCPRCEGLGKVNTIDVSKLIDYNASLNSGAIRFPSFTPGSWRWLRYVRSGYFDNDKKIKDYTAAEKEMLLYATPHKPEHPHKDWPKTASYEGIIPRFEKSFLKRESKENIRNAEQLAGIVTTRECPECHGGRLNQKILSCRINGKNIADCSAMQADELIRFLSGIRASNVKTVLDELTGRLQHVVDIGLPYLNLSRETSTLSGGESQRIKMVKHLGSSLSGLTYIFDEPSIGLHPSDVHKLNTHMQQLRDKGNTLLIVEHDPDVIAIADHVVDMGPHAGKHGGTVVFEGTLAGLKKSGSLTGKYLSKRPEINAHPRKPIGELVIADASLHNLKHITVKIPRGVFTVVTGVAGSGKSSLINHVLTQQYPEVKVIDQRALRGSRRSHLASYTGIFDLIRKMFAKKNGVSESLFSANAAGACPECRGLGIISLDLAFMEDVEETCEVCGGSGYQAAVLEHRLRGKNISEVLQLTVEEALSFFMAPEITGVLERLSRVGLGYIPLGQSLDTISGGEGQRIKLAIELQHQGEIYVYDEPTTGLHLSDIARLMKIFGEMVDNGNTVIVIEHNLNVMCQADWIIDIGPGAGHQGGTVVFEGTPRDLLKHRQSVTGKFLQQYLKHG